MPGLITYHLFLTKLVIFSFKIKVYQTCTYHFFFFKKCLLLCTGLLFPEIHILAHVLSQDSTCTVHEFRYGKRVKQFNFHWQCETSEMFKYLTSITLLVSLTRVTMIKLLSVYSVVNNAYCYLYSTFANLKDICIQPIYCK